ncbi:hypothetical protein A3E49_01205 [Candidatus Saccharibacteria bacterium RIFCSPHIGHO2_12_FULL_49_19]|nr:MAG: hypothetical protein A3E49_01205 [Candidatus Saccharibacteria bacterium RIFCSPHIGHO2_12_FULL_49_19]
MTDVYRAILVATITVIDDGKVLLVKRKQTGFMDGYYATPGGHVDADETIREAAVRELKEETGLIVKEQDLKLFHILQDENIAPKNYISFRFLVKKWRGIPRLCEPEKSEDVGFFDINNPPKLSPYVKLDLQVINNRGVTFSRAEKGEFFKEV